MLYVFWHKCSKSKKMDAPDLNKPGSQQTNVITVRSNYCTITHFIEDDHSHKGCCHINRKSISINHDDDHHNLDPAHHDHNHNQDQFLPSCQAIVGNSTPHCATGLGVIFKYFVVILWVVSVVSE